ncbi:triple tyrosine motif-containing protein [Oceanobacillus sojae]|uniref:triple tyrosine motif-containing protein n=1 Tax=Oceanobacillus sojae TaxID=582851 RepID=UPI003627B14C
MKNNLIILIFISLLFVAIGCSSTNKSELENETMAESETKIENDSIEPHIVKLMIEKVDDSNFYVVTTAEGNELNYAYYVFKDDELLERFAYEKDAHFSYSPNESGTYKVRSFIKDQDGNVVREDTSEIEINL